jgi:hypothetical protein
MDWLPAVTTTALFAAALWLGRNLITTRLARSAQHEFDRKIESVRSELRKNEETFRAELNARALEIQALRSGALTNISTRQAAINQKRLEAIDQLWKSATSLAPTKLLAGYLAVFNVDAMTEAVQRQERAGELLDMMSSGFDPKSLDHASAIKARPFISPMAWAIYSAMQAVAGHTMIRWHAMKSGFKSKGMMDEDKVKELIKAALPYLSDYLDQHGAVVFHYTMEALEDQLLAEMRRMISGAEDDKSNVERAAEILKHSSELMQENESSAVTA